MPLLSMHPYTYPSQRSLVCFVPTYLVPQQNVAVCIPLPLMNAGDEAPSKLVQERYTLGTDWRLPL